MATLYRNYRPQTFTEVVGQDHITKPLEQAIAKQRLAQAYLFHGPRGTGKTTTARLIAQGITGESELDVIEIDAASNRGIDDIRALQEGIALKPTDGDYKVYIIDEVHMLTKEAFTALLKTLEEPVAHAVFILATTEFHKVPETIVSRCQVYRFRRATPEQMTERLTTLLKKEKRQVADDALEFIISRSDGCYRDAESLLGQALGASSKKVTRAALVELLGLPPQELVEQFLAGLVTDDASVAVAALDEAFSGGFDPEQLLHESIRTSREVAIALVKQAAPAASFAQTPNAAERLPKIIRALVQALQDIAYVPEPLIALQLAVVTVCSANPSGPAEAGPPPLIKGGAKKSLPLPEGEKRAEGMGADVEQPKPTPTVAVSASPPAVELDTIKSAWSALIDAVKKENPVAATFLRAMEPDGVDGSAVRVMAHYELHRNFFEKSPNREPVEHALSEALGTPVTIRVSFDGVNGSAEAKQKKTNQENELLETVKEVFGEQATT